MSFIPNTTPTPNWLYNGEMKKMNETELKVVLLVTRKTLGWFDPVTSERKTQDYISQSQFMEFTGKSNRAIATAIQSCVEHGWIIARDQKGSICNTPEKRSRRKVWYQLGSIFIDKISGEESSPDKNLVKKVHQSGEVNDINLVKKVHSTKETITKENIQKSNASVAPLVQEVISLFEVVNPSYKRLFPNKTERAAAARLVSQYGLEKVKAMIQALPSFLVQKGCPQITSPYQLEKKMGQYVAFVRQTQPKRDTIGIAI